MTFDLFVAQEASAVLIGWWKMILIFLPMLGWAWLVATRLDKDARYFHLNAPMWNGVHLAAGAVALAAMLLIPWFWAGLPIGLMILVAPLIVYWRVRDAAVPEHHQFKLSTENISAKMAARRQAKASRQSLLQFTDAAGKVRNVPMKEEPLFPVHMLAEDVIGPAIASRASRLEIAVAPNGGAIKQTVDGVRYMRQTVPTEEALRMIDYVKDIAGLDVQDRRRRQTGEFRVRGPNGETQTHVVSKGSSNAQLLQLDFDRSKRLHKPFDGIGLLQQQIEGLRAVEEQHDRHGIILIGAPSGHGLTTSAYSFIGRHDAYTSNVKTLEREVMVHLDGVDQVEWDTSNPDVDFATNLQSILRRDPDIVLVDEARDADTARVASEPGMQGPLIYITQPLPTIPDQVRDWVKKVGDVKQATRALRAVTNQRLLRSLCPNCRQPYQPTPEQVRKLNLPAKKVSQLYRASGKVQVKNKIENCPICNGAGYLGQTAAFEVFIVDDEARKLLAAGDLKAALAHARRQNMFYLQEAALAKVISGETTIEEVVRATQPAQPTAGPAPVPA